MTSCGACKFLRRKCKNECVFAPYFTYNEAHIHFSAVHKVFGASNFSRLLLRLPQQHRSEAAISVSYEALARIRDPVYGCISYIYALQQQVLDLQEEIEMLGTRMNMAYKDDVINNFINNNNTDNSSSNLMNLPQNCIINGSSCSNNIFEQKVAEINDFHGVSSNMFGISNPKPEEGAFVQEFLGQDMFDYQQLRWLVG